VVLGDGALLAYLGRREKSLLTFLPEEEPERRRASDDVASALVTLVDGAARRALVIASIDGEPASQAAFGPALERAGFTRVGEGYVLRQRLPRAD
jgi:ATP-dependent Lhr-like helicase